MKFIEKIRNYFYDEEDEQAPKKQAPAKVDIPVKEDKIEPKLDDANVNAISERELFKSDPTFNFPIIFDDEDFKEDNHHTPRIETSKTVKTKTVETIVETTRVFKPSPNISPIYGVIDAEAKADKVEPKPKENLLNLYESNKKIDIDDILGKVYEPAKVEVKESVKVIEEVQPVSIPEEKDDFSIDFFNNIEIQTREERKSKLENATEEAIQKVDDKLKSIDELLENTDEEDFYSLVDSMYKEDEEGEK